MPHKTDWFHDAKWGMFIHLLNGLQNNPDHPANMGAGETDWGGFIESLDAERIAAQVAEVNAGYLFLTLMQRSRHLIAPNAAFDLVSGYAPGEACARRDFVADIHAALEKRGIALCLYFTGDGPLDDSQAGAAFGYTSQADKVSFGFVEKWAGVAREYSLRYGPKVRAWWTDGCYAFLGYDEPRLKILADAMRAGNPDALVAMNKGVEKSVSAYSACDDFTTGEMNEFADAPGGRFINGAQWHALSFLGVPPNAAEPWAGWGRPGSKYTGGQLRDYVSRVNARGGVVTIDACLFRDGHIDEEQMEALRALKGLRPAPVDSK